MRASKIRAKKDVAFGEVLATTGSPIKAMRAIEPETVERNKAYASTKAYRIAKRIENSPDIQAKIQENLEKLAKPAQKAIKNALNSDDERLAADNGWKVIEHLRGKPTQRNVNLNASVTIEDYLAQLD